MSAEKCRRAWIDGSAWNPALVAVVTLLAAGCQGRRSGSDRPVDLRNAVARIGDRVITTAELESYIAAQPPVLRARYQTASGKKELVEHLVRFELMAADAEKKGYGQRPEIQRLLKQQMISSLIENELAPSGRPESIPDHQAEAYYQRHSRDLARDEVRVEQILVKDKRKAAQIAASARRVASNDSAFHRLVSTHSEDSATKAQNGDLGFINRTSTAHPQPLIDAAFNLQTSKEVSDPIESPQGLHILRLIERREAAVPPFAEVKSIVKARLFHDRRTKATDTWVNTLRTQAKVEVFEKRLSQVTTTPGKVTLGAQHPEPDNRPSP